MSEEHDHDLTPDVSTETIERIDELEAESPMEMAQAVATDRNIRELLPFAGGGLLLLSALRSLGNGQLRALPKGAAAAALLSYGLRKRRSSEPETFGPDTGGIEGGTDGKDSSDQAHAAANREDAGHESQIDASGDVSESAQLGEEGETGSRVEFTENPEQSEPRTKPAQVGEDKDPRREADDDDEVEVDVSDTAMAEEVAEATGPDPEQAQPSQTDGIEPEETPEEDASDMKVEPGEDADSTETEDDASEGDEDEDEDGDQ
ncbi:hypothetical protein GS429_21010 [Natronorubrum sp. JWXQ-INN-674]|uniref:Uncharacterized protein n=1 Tax=Natronorubrum halalkaliphilum TaxID=2691917 RepID=A0A6B0VSW5_9EURY|nr:hypothetical protein [Natronorubrum halalkaliphilum]MXV64505.1 hypothetical protein [Natronorubrum halalkaliphilum]